MVWMSAIHAGTEKTIMQAAIPLLGSMTRWIAPTTLAVAIGLGAVTPTPAHAQDALTRVLVDVADVVFNNGNAYSRYGEEIPANRLVVGRDAYGRPVYYRQVRNGRYPYQQRAYDGYGRRNDDSRDNDRNPPYGNAYGYYRHHGATRCDQDGDRCWNSRHDRHGDDGDREHRGERDGDQGDDD